jgi:hypothetical protein
MPNNVNGLVSKKNWEHLKRKKNTWFLLQNELVAKNPPQIFPVKAY